MVLPEGQASVDPALPEAEATRAHAGALLRTRAATATVVAWDPAVPRLVVSGLALEEVTVGSMVTR